jgi:hypothetical protein
MSRIATLRTPCKLFVAVAFLASAASFEGVSNARTTAQPLRVQTETPAAAVHSSTGDVATRIRICHISKHPRDGMPAEEHACPLVIAEATEGQASALPPVSVN